MHKIIHLIVLVAFLIQQIAWATPPLNWEPDFQSASVLPYYDDVKGNRWILVAKPTYGEKIYEDEPAWKDFGGIVEDGEFPITAAVRELKEETNEQISATEQELSAGFSHRFDMQNSLFANQEGIQRHTIFFKKLEEMTQPQVEEGIEEGPTEEGKKEIAQYQWIKVKDLYTMDYPAGFGKVLGLYTPESLRVDPAHHTAQSHYFSIPFFILLQQTAVKNFLLGKKKDLKPTYSQITFTSPFGFQDWRLESYGFLEKQDKTVATINFTSSIPLNILTNVQPNTVHHISSVQQIPKGVVNNTSVLVVDADETIAATHLMAQNFENQRQHQEAMTKAVLALFTIKNPQNATKSEAEILSSEDYLTFQNTLESISAYSLGYDLTESHWPEFLAKARDQGAKVLVISSRNFFTEEGGVEEKARLKLFHQLGFSNDDLLYSGPEDKCQKDITLAKWLKTQTTQYNRVVAIDNLSLHGKEITASTHLSETIERFAFTHHAYANYFNAKHQQILTAQFAAALKGKYLTDKQVLEIIGEEQDLEKIIALIEKATASIKLRLLHNPEEALYQYLFAPNSPNKWQIEFTEGINADQKKHVREVMETFTKKQELLAEIQLTQSKQLKTPLIIEPENTKQKLELFASRLASDAIIQAITKEMALPFPTKKTYAAIKAEIEAEKANTLPKVDMPFPALPKTMTDAQLEHYLETVNLTNTTNTLEAYKKKILQLPYHHSASGGKEPVIKGITEPDFVSAVEKVLAAERANSQMFTAYHACKAEVAFLNVVYAVLKEKLGFPAEVISWRLFDTNSRKYASSSHTAIDNAQSSEQVHYLNPHDLMIAANASLTGFPEDDGCRTLTYWQQSYSEAEFDLNRKLTEVFIGLGLAEEIAEDLAQRLYSVYEQNYFVQKDSTKRIPVGVLRQIFVRPELVDAVYSLAGWYYDNPLDFQYRTLPDDTMLDIYEGLEEAETSSMKKLSPVSRFMNHIRAGHSVKMQENIKKYWHHAPNGKYPWNLQEFELRLGVNQQFHDVLTYYYPETLEDKTREACVIKAIDENLNSTLNNAELPIRSFDAFKLQHALLTEVMKNTAGIEVSIPNVDLQDFKRALSQCDMPVIDAYLENLQAPPTIKIKDTYTQQETEVPLIEYIARICIQNSMAAGSISSIIRKHVKKLLPQCDLQNTPYALFIIIVSKGLNFLTQSGWDGNVNAHFKIFIPNEDQNSFHNETDDTKKSPGKIKQVSILDLMQPQHTDNLISEMHQGIGSQTDFSQLPDIFWENLVSANGLVEKFIQCFAAHTDLKNWNAIVENISKLKPQTNFYQEYLLSIIKIFEGKEKAGNSNIKKFYTLDFEAVRKILTQLKRLLDLDAFNQIVKPALQSGSSLYFHKNSKPVSTEEIYGLMHSLDVFDPIQMLSTFLHRIKEGNISAFLKQIQNDGYSLDSSVFSLSSHLQDASFKDIEQLLPFIIANDPDCSQSKYVIESIQKNTKISASEKARACSTYIDSIQIALPKIISRMTSFQASTEELQPVTSLLTKWWQLKSAQEQNTLLHQFSKEENYLQVAKILGCSEAEALKTQLSLIDDAEKARSFIFSDRSINLEADTFKIIVESLREYIPALFEQAYQDPNLITSFNAVVFHKAGCKLPEETNIELFTQKLFADSLLFLSPQHIQQVLSGYGNWVLKFKKFIYPQNLEQHLTELLPSIAYQVKPLLTDTSRQNAQSLLSENPEYMSPAVKTFLETLITQ